MNIFYVNENPTDAAICLPDKLVVKMPLESAQMLSTAHRVLDGDERADTLGLYKTAMKKPDGVLLSFSMGTLYAKSKFSFQYEETQGKLAKIKA